MFVRYDYNEFGTPISVHICEFCGLEFTVTPAVKAEKMDQYRGCLAPLCKSYDPDRDAEKLFDEEGKTDKIKIVESGEEEVLH